jgi:chaperone required for assembly of F1-ATPase
MALGALNKRFYSEVAVGTAGGGFEVRLDGRGVRTPQKAALILPNRALAEAVREEWAGQGEHVRPATMPLTSLACTAVDRVAPRRAEAAGEIVGYAGTDLLCYRAEHPAALVARQAAVWQPLLDWAALVLDAPLKVTSGILPADQTVEAVAALRSAVETLDDLRLAALGSATRTSGSLVIGLALSRGRVSADAAFDAAELDATFQIEKWGEDLEATRRRTAVRDDLTAARRLLDLLAG